MRIKKQLIALGLSIALLSGMVPTSEVSAAKKVSLITKKLTVKAGQSKKLKLKNNKKTVKWTVISGKKNITLKNKKKTGVTVVGKKKGTAKVQAKVGKKKYTCKVTVQAKGTSKPTSPTPGQGKVLTLYYNGKNAEEVKTKIKTSKVPVHVIVEDNVTSLGDDAFYGCSRLTSITIPSSVTVIGGAAFYGCSGLTSIAIPDNVDIIGYYAFNGCSGLTSITIPSSVTFIDYGAFHGCSSLTGITVAEGNKIYDSRNHCNAIIVSETNTLITGCKNTTIPDSVSSIGYDAFRGCIGLTSIAIPDSVTSLGSDAFNGCIGLTSITIPDSVTSIDDSAFRGCSEVTSITVAEGNNTYDSRNHCNAIIRTKTNTLITGCKNTTIPDSVSSIGGEAFSGCIGLTSITIPDSVSSIGGSAFYGCNGLSSITIPSSVTSIGEEAFNGCSGLTSIVWNGKIYTDVDDFFDSFETTKE